MNARSIFTGFTQVRVKRLVYRSHVGGGGVGSRVEVGNGIHTDRTGSGDHDQGIHRRLGEVELKRRAIGIAVEDEGDQQGFARGTFDNGMGRHAQTGQRSSHAGSKH